MAEINKNDEVINESTGQIEQDQETEHNSPNLVNMDRRERRVTRAPTWMDDSVTGEGLSEEEIELKMAFVSPEDPITYAEAVKSLKWRLAMDSEITSIENNQTWKLTELPAGAKEKQ